jgi:hypothetical protein
MINYKIPLLLFFALSVYAFEPLKDQSIMIFWDYDASINDSEIALMKKMVKEPFRKKASFPKENDSIPQWLQDYHSKYNRYAVKPIHNTDNKIGKIMLVHYERKIVYDLPGSFQILAFIPYGMVPITMTDDDPDWCHQSMLSIDIYDVKTGKRNYTFVSNQESGSMNSYDQEEYDDNIESIADDIDERFFDVNSWKLFEDSYTKKTIRDTSSLVIPLKKSLCVLFDNKLLGPDSVTVTVSVDEFGNVFDIKTNRIGTATDTLFRKFFSTLNMGRVTLPNDKAVFRITFKSTSYQKFRMVNGYYATIDGYRDKEEIWKILNWHIDQYVKNWRMVSGNRSEEFLHIEFVINKSGNVENLVFVNGTGKALKNEEKSNKIISGWEFGNKGDEKDRGTHVECVFTLNNDKFSVK